jgi:hypothetical protein
MPSTNSVVGPKNFSTAIIELASTKCRKPNKVRLQNGKQKEAD